MVNLVFGFLTFFYPFSHVNDVNFLTETNDFWFLSISRYTHVDYIKQTGIIA